MNRSPNFEKNLKCLANRPECRRKELERVEREAIAAYSGQIDELRSALGILRLGDQFGWKVLILVHNKRTLRKYEDILGIDIKEFFPEEGPIADRSIGYKFATQLSNFWKAVSGDEKIPERRGISQ